MKKFFLVVRGSKFQVPPKVRRGNISKYFLHNFDENLFQIIIFFINVMKKLLLYKVGCYVTSTETVDQLLIYKLGCSRQLRVIRQSYPIGWRLFKSLRNLQIFTLKKKD